MSAAKAKLVYEFAKTDGGEEIGFNDSVTTTFKGHPAYSLARESIQNIIDAVDDKLKPVIAEFRLKKIKSQELPNSKELEIIIEACKKYYSNNQSNVDFFSKAHKTLNKNEEIAILTIADYNTIGMPGEDDDINGNYYNFLKSSGASQKSGGVGGSFGLGKGAYYAASSFHTIFVSSIYDHDKYVFQGKLRLVTHKRAGEKFQSTGSFGYLKQKPVRNAKDIPLLFSRNKQGTDISIVGFYESSNWEEVITSSVLTNFWLAILQGKLTVRVSDLEISTKTIDKLMFSYFKEYEKETDDYQNPLQPYLAYVNEESDSFIENLPVLGEVRLRVLVKENYNKRISFFRGTGMQIKKTKYPLPNAFTGVFECDNEKGNKILRAMENPQHNQWDPENAREKTDEIYKSAKKAEKELRGFIRSSLKKVFSAQNAEELDIPGLSKYLYIQTQAEANALTGPGSTDENIANKNEPLNETAREIGVENTQEAEVEIGHQINVIKKNTKVIPGKKKKIGGGGGGSEEGSPGSGEEDSSGKESRLLKDIGLRSYAISLDDGSIAHVVVIHGSPGTKATLAFAVGTDDSFGSVAIKDAKRADGSELKKRDNRISGVEIGPRGTEKIMIRFEDNDKYALNIQAYEDK